jgi:Na+/H+ antiporter NhaC
MPSDKNPVFRKVIIPWYNSTTVYIIVLIIMLLVLFFAMAGISVSRENAEYHGYVWVPILLLVMSAAIIIATTARLIKRYTQRSTKSFEVQ